MYYTWHFVADQGISSVPTSAIARFQIHVRQDTVEGFLWLLHVETKNLTPKQFVVLQVKVCIVKGINMSEVKFRLRSSRVGYTKV